MAFQAVFQRYELKYLLTLEQKEKVLKGIKRNMAEPPYSTFIMIQIPTF